MISFRMQLNECGSYEAGGYEVWGWFGAFMAVFGIIFFPVILGPIYFNKLSEDSYLFKVSKNLLPIIIGLIIYTIYSVYENISQTLDVWIIALSFTLSLSLFIRKVWEVKVKSKYSEWDKLFK